MEKIYVLLLNWNGKKDTLECLASLEKISSPSFQTLVVDNGSTDGSVDAIRKNFPLVPLFESKANLGFAGGNNLGIQWALQKGADWILLLNNDTIVDPHILEEFLKAAHEKPKAKILGAKIYRYSDRMRIDHLGGFWDPAACEFHSPAKNSLDDGTCFEEMEKVDYVCGAAMFIHRSVFDAVGLLEPKFFLYWEETDFCFRAKRQGFETWTAPKAKVWHKVSSSFSGGKPHMHYFWWRSRLLWLKRNCSVQERKQLYRRVVLPDLWKTVRHLALRSTQNGLLYLIGKKPDAVKKEKVKRLKAALLGAFHYGIDRFGNCPESLQSSGQKKGKHCIREDEG